MSRLSSGEKEFLSSPDDAKPSARPAAPAATAAPASPPPAVDTIETIDARGISAPLPLLRAHRALRAMRAGQLLKIVTSSKESIAEFQALAKYVVGYELVSQEEDGEDVVHLLRRRR